MEYEPSACFPLQPGARITHEQTDPATGTLLTWNIAQRNAVEHHNGKYNTAAAAAARAIHRIANLHRIHSPPLRLLRSQLLYLVIHLDSSRHHSRQQHLHDEKQTSAAQ